MDDSRPVRQALRRLFDSMRRFTVVGEAKDGYEALEALVSLQPHLVILDIRMPRMNGLEVLQALQQQPLPAKVIVFSQHGDEVYRQKCLQLGAYGFFDKVAGFDHFHRALAELQPGSSRTI